MPKPTRTTPEDINQISVQVVRNDNESESIDLAAEATQESTPGKALKSSGKTRSSAGNDKRLQKPRR